MKMEVERHECRWKLERYIGGVNVEREKRNGGGM